MAKNNSVLFRIYQKNKLAFEWSVILFPIISLGYLISLFTIAFYIHPYPGFISIAIFSLILGLLIQKLAHWKKTERLYGNYGDFVGIFALVFPPTQGLCFLYSLIITNLSSGIDFQLIALGFVLPILASLLISWMLSSGKPWKINIWSPETSVIMEVVILCFLYTTIIWYILISIYPKII